MSNQPVIVWREENQAIFAQTIAAAAEQLSVPQSAVEKDYWVCQALRAIEAHAPGETIFKGGTSLEKQKQWAPALSAPELLFVWSPICR